MEVFTELELDLTGVHEGAFFERISSQIKSGSKGRRTIEKKHPPSAQKNGSSFSCQVYGECSCCSLFCLTTPFLIGDESSFIADVSP